MFSDSLTQAQAAETCLSCFQPDARLVASKIYDGKWDACFFSDHAGKYWLAHCRSIFEVERQHGSFLPNFSLTRSRSLLSWHRWDFIVARIKSTRDVPIVKL